MRTRRLVTLSAALVTAVASQIAIAPAAHASPNTFANNRPCRNGYVSISFDDGPTATTPDLLKALNKNNITATFFDIGQNAEQYPKYVRAESDAGHEVANHSYDHPNFLDIGDDAALAQLAKTQTILSKGRLDRPDFYRPPYGATDPVIAERAKAELGLTEIIWTVDTNDWDGRSTDDIVNTVATAQDGDFVLMHDGYPNTIAAIKPIADGLAKRGLCDGRIARSSTPTQAWENLSFNATVKAWNR